MTEKVRHGGQNQSLPAITALVTAAAPVIAPLIQPRLQSNDAELPRVIVSGMRAPRMDTQLLMNAIQGKDPVTDIKQVAALADYLNGSSDQKKGQEASGLKARVAEQAMARLPVLVMAIMQLLNKR